MSFESWLSSLKQPRRHASRKATRRCSLRSGSRLRVELLEDRVVPSGAPLAQPFNTLATGFTQELVATLPSGTNETGGYGFDSQGNVYTSSLNNSHLYKIDMSTTIPQPGNAGQPPFSAT